MHLDLAIQPSIYNNVERAQSPLESETNRASCFTCLFGGSILNRIEPEQVFNVEGSLGYIQGSQNNLPTSSAGRASDRTSDNLGSIQPSLGSPVGSVSSRTSEHLGSIQPRPGASSTNPKPIPGIDGLNGLRR